MADQQIETMTSEELGLALQQQYEQLFAIQQNIRMISVELGKRNDKHKQLDKETKDERPT